jgi:predicted nucleic acid-binding Zn ribbon protein
MVTELRNKPVADRSIIFEMRRAGAPMREIAQAVGISKERVRQILARNLGSTQHEWLSTLQVCARTGLPRNRVLELHEQGIIVPASTWSAGKRHYFLWAADSVERITTYFGSHHLCRVCNKPLPRNRILFCSDECRQERHKYKHMTAEEKQRVLENIRRYREKKRQQQKQVIISAMSSGVAVL